MVSVLSGRPEIRIPEHGVARLVAPIGEALAGEAVVRTALFDDAARLRNVQEIRGFVDADAPPDVELRFGEGVGALVRPDDLFTRSRLGMHKCSRYNRLAMIACAARDA